MNKKHSLKSKPEIEKQLRMLKLQAKELRERMAISEDKLEEILDFLDVTDGDDEDVIKLEQRLLKMQNALAHAKSQVKAIDDDQLLEISKYKNPPERVKLCLEAVFLLLDRKVLDWNQIKKEMNKEGFIQRVLHFNIEKVPKKIQKRLDKEYIRQEKWDLEKFRRASKAIAPLAQWIDSVHKINKDMKKMKAKGDLKKYISEKNNKVKEKAKLEEKLQMDSTELNHLDKKIEKLERKLSKLSNNNEVKEESFNFSPFQQNKPKRKVQATMDMMDVKRTSTIKDKRRTQPSFEMVDQDSESESAHEKRKPSVKKKRKKTSTQENNSDSHKLILYDQVIRVKKGKNENEIDLGKTDLKVIFSILEQRFRTSSESFDKEAIRVKMLQNELEQKEEYIAKLERERHTLTLRIEEIRKTYILQLDQEKKDFIKRLEMDREKYMKMLEEERRDYQKKLENEMLKWQRREKQNTLDSLVIRNKSESIVSQNTKQIKEFFKPTTPTFARTQRIVRSVTPDTRLGKTTQLVVNQNSYVNAPQYLQETYAVKNGINPLYKKIDFDEKNSFNKNNRFGSKVIYAQKSMANLSNIRQPHMVRANSKVVIKQDKSLQQFINGFPTSGQFINPETVISYEEYQKRVKEGKIDSRSLIK